MKKWILMLIFVALSAMMFNSAIASEDSSFGPAPNSGDGIPDGSGLDAPNECLPLNHWDYCRLCGPCDEGEGDCDDDSECEAGLICDQVLGGIDTCQEPVSCELPEGHLDYCRNCGLCAAGQGDCDSDSECESGLTCVQVLGADVCCPHPIGHLDYCRDCGPCGAEQGDCDNDGECQSGLTCVQVIGTDTCQ